ncbi:MAG: hypothetical protein HY689_11585 [Chloroflexi bacterium]|nr:hypothetical protein [Chloroflexota bacterium]
MMRSVPALLTVVALLSAALVFPEPAAACSLAGFPNAQVRLQQQTDAADLIIVGTVIAERPLTGTWEKGYASTVRPVAVLKGETPDGPIELSPLGFLGPDCSGGPRLAAGERVLLFLQRGDPPWLPGARQEGWRVALAGQGKYRFHERQAQYQDYGPLEPAGSAEGLVKEVAALAGSLPDQTARALWFAQGNDGEPEVTVMGVSGDGGAVVPGQERPTTLDADPLAGWPPRVAAGLGILAIAGLSVLVIGAVVGYGLLRRVRWG